jgi:DNA-binding CsgD family transcriptional regulator
MNEDINDKPNWYRKLAQLVTACGDEDFCKILADCCQLCSPYNSTVIIAFRPQARPQPLFHNLESKQLEPALKPYLAGAYLLDPFYQLVIQGAPDGVYRLKDLAPDGFFDSEYYRNYYADTRLRDEAALLVRISADLHIQVSMGVRRTTAAVRQETLSQLSLVAPLLIAICQQHWSQQAVLENDTQHTLGAPLDIAFKNFGKKVLSPRECEVIQLILKGHSSKSMARLLDISESTVKMHRKRFFAKLGISSQAELFSLFLEAIALVPLGSHADPLELYFGDGLPEA